MDCNPVTIVRALLGEFPREMTVGQVLDQLDRMHPREEAECGNCHKKIHRDGMMASWVHADGMRGCRAGSYDPSRDGGPWDDSIPKSWMAKPI
jgi:hypothetical protein